MRSVLFTVSVAILAAVPAFAQAKDAKPAAPPSSTPPAAAPAAPAGPDMSKMGPWSRKPANDAALKKEITDFLKQEDELMKKGDFDASVARIDFPVMMATDDSKGVTKVQEWSKDKYVGEMKKFWETMPKDMKVNHKQTITVLSDAMASVTDDYTMMMGKQKLAGRSLMMLVKKDGQWKFKMFAEPGWGDEPPKG
jgi:hypothetical protein